MTYRELLRWGVCFLAEQAIAEASADAWILFAYATGIDRTHYYLRQQEKCPQEVEERYRELAGRRARHIPVQYLTGVQEFMGLPFRVSPQVLIPRQDTELLVLEAEQRLRPGERVLDLCTGSGCIIISLAIRQQIEAFGADLSPEALTVARANALELGAAVTFYESDLFAQVEGEFDCIVSNPPYIPRREIATLMPEVAEQEPLLALDGHEDGLYFYRRIIREADAYLRRGGWLLLEIGSGQGADVTTLLRTYKYEGIAIKKDLAGLDRVVMGRRS